jgi:signal transduction histidine kinase
VKPSRNPSIFWRLFASYLLIISVGCFTLYWAGDAFVAFFSDRHMGGMMNQMQRASPMMEAMATDLNAAYREATHQAMVWGLGVSAFVAAIVGVFVSQRIVAPIRKMQRAGRRIAAGQYQERLDPQAPGEIGELAETFNEMAEALEQTETRRVELLANVAHEFKTPLSSLHGYVTGLQDGLFKADEETLAACARQVARLERLAGDLSLLSRVETGQEVLCPRPMNVTEILKQAAAAFRPAYDQSGVILCVASAPTALKVQADPQRTAQVLANLLDNALKHTPRGGEVRLSATEAKAAEVLFEVKDTGEGVADEDLPHLFTRFYRADKSRHYDPEQGSGIGLTIAKHYVEKQGGRIGVESAPGQGSRFWFTLSCSTAETGA